MNSKYYCTTCNLFCTGPENYEQHENSAKHKKKVALQQGHPTNPTTGGNGNPQPFCCITCNVDLGDFPSFQAHVNSLQHADMVRNTRSGSMQNQSESILQTTGTSEFDSVDNPGNQAEAATQKMSNGEAGAVNNPGPSIPYEGYNPWLGSVAHCVTCKMQFSGHEQYNQHLAGKQHKKKLKLLGLSTDLNPSVNGSATIDNSNNVNIPFLKCDACQLPFSGPIPYQQHLASDNHKKKVIQKELMDANLSFDTVDSKKMPLVDKTKEETVATVIASGCKEYGSCVNGSGDRQPYAKCTFCNMEFSGPEPYQLHVESSGHQKKVESAEQLKTVLTEKVEVQHISANTVFNCNICKISVTGPIPYEDHINSLKHKKKAQSVEFLKQFEAIKGQSGTQSDKINGINGTSAGMNSEFYCEVCRIHTSGPEPYRQHIYGEPHKKKERAANAFGNADNTNNFQNGLSEKNNPNQDLKKNGFYVKNDLILSDGLESNGLGEIEKLNMQVFYPDDEIIFDNNIKKVSDL